MTSAKRMLHDCGWTQVGCCCGGVASWVMTSSSPSSIKAVVISWTSALPILQFCRPRRSLRLNAQWMRSQVCGCWWNHCSLSASSPLKCCSLPALQPVFVRLAAVGAPVEGRDSSLHLLRTRRKFIRLLERILAEVRAALPTC